MMYLEEIEEVVFEPEFGYGYEPDVKKRKKKRNAEETRERFTGMKKPLSNPLVPLFVSLLFAAVLLMCVLLASLSKKPEVSARVQPYTDTACRDAVFPSEDV